MMANYNDPKWQGVMGWGGRLAGWPAAKMGVLNDKVIGETINVSFSIDYIEIK